MTNGGGPGLGVRCALLARAEEDSGTASTASRRHPSPLVAMAEEGILSAPAPIRVYENTYQMEPLEFQRFHRSAAEKLLHEVLEDKMAFTNERDKKGRLAFVYNSDDAAETIRDIVEECQKKVVGTLPLPPLARAFFSAHNNGVLLQSCGCRLRFNNSRG